MNDKKQIAALIVAAGKGSRARRYDDDLPKQYCDIGGRSILDRTVAQFLSDPRISQVIVVISPGAEDLYQSAVKSDDEKLLPPALGGETRQLSVFAGLQALQPYSPDLVLIHDGVRPFVDAEVIGSVIEGLAEHQCVLPVVAVSDTLVRGADGVRSETVDRKDLYRAQTPQGFHFEEIFAGHQEAVSEGRVDFTDDSSIAEWRGAKTHLVEGSANNVKITTHEDFAFGEALLMQETKNESAGHVVETRVGSGYDVHAFEPGDAVILCGVSIPFEMKLKGHSDADVGLHALTDAIFGALADGDIGSHFPPSDAQWKGKDSAHFLEYAIKRVDERGGKIVHLDVTLICEAPKIGPHRDAMRARISEITNVALDRISVKATTSERLGFTGRKEGIAAMASATVAVG